MVYKLTTNRVWRSYRGGSRIDRLLGSGSGEDGFFPEDWVASTVLAKNPGEHPADEGLSRTADGDYLRDIIAKDPQAALGQGMLQKYGPNMSILVKLLDSAQRLAVQVHPTNEFAMERFASPFGKTESWYVIAADEGAHVFLGFKKGITRKAWMECFEKQDIAGMMNWLNKIDVHPGDCFLVKGGVPHAIGGGSLIVELQEPTDLVVRTERVTIAGVRLEGNALHAGLGYDGMFDCFDYDGMDAQEIREKYQAKPRRIDDFRSVILDMPVTDKFVMQQIVAPKPYSFNAQGKYAVAIVLEGNCEVGGVLAGPGCQLFITADHGDILVNPQGQAKLVVCMPN